MNRLNLKLFYELLKTYVAFRTVSAPTHLEPDQVSACVAFLEELLTKGGVTVTKWSHGNLNPIVFGHYQVDPTLPTVLVYGHYDVVSVKNDDWEATTPYDLYWDEGAHKFYGRGSTDNKGQNLIHIMAVLAAIAEGKLACNVKFFIEGNEEIGSGGVDAVIEEHKEELAADYVIVSDGEMAGDNPLIELSLRGLVNIMVTVKTSDKDIHSGGAGGLAYNSLVEASKLIASLYGNDGAPSIDGFYDGINEQLIGDKDIQRNNRALSRIVDWKNVVGSKYYKAHQADPITRVGLFPSIEPVGMISGGAQDGFKHIIPGYSRFMLNCRIVGSQDPHVIAAAVIEHLNNMKPGYVELETQVLMPNKAIELNLRDEIIADLTVLLEDVYGKAPLFNFVGGGIPVVAYFKDILKSEVLLVPLSTNDCNMHGGDENFSTNLIQKGLEFSYKFFTTPFTAKK